jgi:hypothetical protein
MNSKDWNCINCNYLNFKRNKICRKCNLFDKNKNEYINNDWICKKCFYINKINNLQLKLLVKCNDCNTLYTDSIQSEQNNYLIQTNYKLVYEKIGLYIDWNCIENMKMPLNYPLCLLTIRSSSSRSSRTKFSKSQIISGIKNITMARHPFTTHSISCYCESCAEWFY